MASHMTRNEQPRTSRGCSWALLPASDIGTHLVPATAGGPLGVALGACRVVLSPAVLRGVPRALDAVAAPLAVLLTLLFLGHWEVSPPLLLGDYLPGRACLLSTMHSFRLGCRWAREDSDPGPAITGPHPRGGCTHYRGREVRAATHEPAWELGRLAAAGSFALAARTRRGRDYLASLTVRPQAFLPLGWLLLLRQPWPGPRLLCPHYTHRSPRRSAPGAPTDLASRYCHPHQPSSSWEPNRKQR